MPAARSLTVDDRHELVLPLVRAWSTVVRFNGTELKACEDAGIKTACQADDIRRQDQRPLRRAAWNWNAPAHRGLLPHYQVCRGPYLTRATRLPCESRSRPQPDQLGAKQRGSGIAIAAAMLDDDTHPAFLP